MKTSHAVSAPSARLHTSGEFAAVTLDGRNTIHVTDAAHARACAAAFIRAAALLEGQAPGAGDCRVSAGRRLLAGQQLPPAASKDEVAAMLGKYRRRLSLVLDAYDDARAAGESEVVRDLLDALQATREAIDIPYPATVGDGRKRDEILGERVMHAVLILRAVLAGDLDHVPYDTAYLRERLAEHPAEGYRTWNQAVAEHQRKAAPGGAA